VSIFDSTTCISEGEKMKIFMFDKTCKKVEVPQPIQLYIATYQMLNGKPIGEPEYEPVYVQDEEVLRKYAIDLG
jgi:hypothetical protein